MVTLQFDIATVPNFVKIVKQGSNNCLNIPISDLSKEEIEEYAEMYKIAILDNWKIKREQNGIKL